MPSVLPSSRGEEQILLPKTRCHAQAGLPRTDLERPRGCVLECVCVCVCEGKVAGGRGVRGRGGRESGKKKKGWRECQFP